MATKTVRLNPSSVTNLTSTMSLADGTTYDLQNTGYKSVHLIQSATLPTITSAGFEIEPKKFFDKPMKQVTGQSWYAYSIVGDTLVVVNETAT